MHSGRPRLGGAAFATAAAEAFRHRPELPAQTVPASVDGDAVGNEDLLGRLVRILESRVGGGGGASPLEAFGLGGVAAGTETDYNGAFGSLIGGGGGDPRGLASGAGGVFVPRVKRPVYT